MGEIICPKCGKHVSDFYSTCISCGAEFPQTAAPSKSALKKNVPHSTAIACGCLFFFIAGLILIGLMFGEKDKKAPQSSAYKPPASIPKPRDPLEMVEGSLSFKSGEYVSEITGLVKNVTGQHLNHAYIEFDLFDNQKNKIGMVNDVCSGLDPGETWKFKCPVFDRDASTCKMTELKGY